MRKPSFEQLVVAEAIEIRHYVETNFKNHKKINFCFDFVNNDKIKEEYLRKKIKNRLYHQLKCKGIEVLMNLNLIRRNV